MQADEPKQFLLLKNKPLFIYSMEAFYKAFDDVHIILVLPENFLARGNAILENFFPDRNIIVTKGGETRFHSVKNGLQFITEESIVFVHDAVRCLVSPVLIERCFEAAVNKGSAIPVVNANDSMRRVMSGSNTMLNRDEIKVVQTPQTFKSSILLSSFQCEYSPLFTDEATVVEQQGISLNLVEGDATNIKITFPVDLIIAEQIIASAT